MNLTEEELTKLQNATTQTEWNKVCDEVKRAREGQYPGDWYARVHLTGLQSKAASLPR